MNKGNNNSLFTIVTSVKERKILKKNLEKHIKSVNFPTENLQVRKETILNTIEYNRTSKNQKFFYSMKTNYNNLNSKLCNKPIDIDKFIKEINSFLLPNDKTFENIQMFINDLVIMNKGTYEIDEFTQSLIIEKIPINSFNYELIFRVILNNIFKKAFKLAFLNKTFISKDDIKEEYQKQIKSIKIYLIFYNKKIEDLINNQKFESPIIKKSYSALRLNLNKNKLDSNVMDKKYKPEIHKGNIKIIQANSSKNNFFNKEKSKKFVYINL